MQLWCRFLLSSSLLSNALMFFLADDVQAREVDACWSEKGQTSCGVSSGLVKNKSLSALYKRQVSILQKDDGLVLQKSNSKVAYHAKIAYNAPTENANQRKSFRPIFQKWMANSTSKLASARLNATDKSSSDGLVVVEQKLPPNPVFTVASINEHNFVKPTKELTQENQASLIGLSRGVVEVIPSNLPKPIVVAMNEAAPAVVQKHIELPDISSSSATTIVEPARDLSAALPKPIVVAMNDVAPAVVQQHIELPDISSSATTIVEPARDLSAALPKPIVVAINDVAPAVVQQHVELPDISSSSATTIVEPARDLSAALPKPIVVAMNDVAPAVVQQHVELPDISSSSATTIIEPVQDLSAALPKPIVVAMNEVVPVSANDNIVLPTEKDIKLIKNDDSLFNKLKTLVEVGGNVPTSSVPADKSPLVEPTKLVEPAKENTKENIPQPKLESNNSSQVISALPKIDNKLADSTISVKPVAVTNVPLPAPEQILPSAADLLPSANQPVKLEKHGAANLQNNVSKNDISPDNNVKAQKSLFSSSAEANNNLPSASNLSPTSNLSPASSLSPESRAIVDSLPNSLDAPVKSKPKLKKIGVSREKDSEAFPEGEWQSNEAVGVDIKVKSRKFDASHELEKAYDAFMAGNTQAAIESYKAVLSAEPQNKDALFGVATTYHRVGLLDEARRYYGQLLAIDPYNRDALNNFFVLVGEESPQDALRQMSALEARNPGFSPIPAQMALLYEKLGDLQKAVTTMRRAVSYAPENISYRYNLAILCDHADERQEAMKIYQELVDAAYRGEELPAPLRSIQERLTFLRSNSR